MATFIHRMVGAALFDGRTYEEVEADREATLQAVTVVTLSSLSAGMAWIDIRTGRVGAFVAMSVVALLAWACWATLVTVIGKRLLPQPQTRSDVGELLRTLGFAQSPGVLRVLGLLPFVGFAATVAVEFWTLATMVVAVQHALDYSSVTRAVAVCVTGWLLSFIVFLMIGLLFAPVVS